MEKLLKNKIDNCIDKQKKQKKFCKNKKHVATNKCHGQFE